MAEVIPGIYLAGDPGGINAYVIVDDGITLVDTGMGGSEILIFHQSPKL